MNTGCTVGKDIILTTTNTKDSFNGLRNLGHLPASISTNGMNVAPTWYHNGHSTKQTKQTGC